MTSDSRAAAARRPPTMNDVAKEAGVALKTVSRYVNGETNIDPTLASRIGAAIELLGYRRNLVAASIRPGRTSKVIGLIIGDLANPYYSTLARAVEARAWSSGYMLTTASSEEDGGRHDRAIDRLIDQRVDALLVVPPRHPGRPWADVRPPIPPVVFLDRPADLESAPTVLADNAGGARSAVRALAQAGACRIAFVGDSLEIYTMAERYRGFADGLAEIGHPFRGEDIRTDAHGTEEATNAIAALISDGGVDALFAANNRAAVGALHAFSDAGRRLPMVAFDDFEAATLVHPAITVISQDVAGMGRLAADIAIHQLHGGGWEPTVTTLPTELILRGSESMG